jgi:hypothetical protein
LERPYRPFHRHRERRNANFDDRIRSVDLIVGVAPLPVAEAAFVISASLTMSESERKRIEQAMLAALQKAQEDGVSDVAELRARILAARDESL